jgi:hypothetical protein
VTADPAMLERALQVQRGFGRVFCDWRERSRTGEVGFPELDDYVALVFGDVHDDQSTQGGYRQINAQ